MRHSFSLARLTMAALLALGSCTSSSPTSSSGRPEGGSTVGSPDSGAGSAGLAQDGSADIDGDTGPPVPMAPCPSRGNSTFAYQPAGPGVTGVEVYGGFGLTGDWKQPLMTLTQGPDGTFTGTATLPDGQYSYLYRVQGGKFGYWFVDPLNSDRVGCPAGAPIYAEGDEVPCSQLTIPLEPPAPAFHFYGVLLLNGQPLSNISVQYHYRLPTSPAHALINGTYSQGSGLFDTCVAPGGVYFVRVYNDAAGYTPGQPLPDANTLQQLRFGSHETQVSDGGIGLLALDLGFHDYPQLGPTGTASLPTTFTFVVPDGGAARWEFYKVPPPDCTAVPDGGVTGCKGSGIGDQNDDSEFSQQGSAIFNGRLAGDASTVEAGVVYLWDEGQNLPPPTADAGHWYVETMLLPIVFQ
jgi:hypothetical protein